MISNIQPAYPWQKEEEMRSNIYIFLFVYLNQNGSNSRGHLLKEFLKNYDKNEEEMWSSIYTFFVCLPWNPNGSNPRILEKIPTEFWRINPELLKKDFLSSRPPSNKPYYLESPSELFKNIAVIKADEIPTAQVDE